MTSVRVHRAVYSALSSLEWIPFRHGRRSATKGGWVDGCVETESSSRELTRDGGRRTDRLHLGRALCTPTTEGGPNPSGRGTVTVNQTISKSFANVSHHDTTRAPGVSRSGRSEERPPRASRPLDGSFVHHHCLLPGSGSSPPRTTQKGPASRSRPARPPAPSGETPPLCGGSVGPPLPHGPSSPHVFGPVRNPHTLSCPTGPGAVPTLSPLVPLRPFLPNLHWSTPFSPQYAVHGTPR